MAVLTAHMTELEAVNEMLRSIGETAVQGLASGQQDAAQAEEVLHQVSRRVQAQGWHCNTKRGVTITKNIENQFPLGVNVLKVDTVNPRGYRRQSYRPSAHINVGMRRAADGNKFLLYDIDRNSETWATLTELSVDIIEFLPYEDLTPLLQTYVHKAAGHQYQKTAVSSTVLWEFTREDVDEAQMNAIQEDAANEDFNVFRDTAAREVVYRNNPLYGT